MRPNRTFIQPINLLNGFQVAAREIWPVKNLRRAGSVRSDGAGSDGRGSLDGGFVRWFAGNVVSVFSFFRTVSQTGPDGCLPAAGA